MKGTSWFAFILVVIFGATVGIFGGSQLAKYIDAARTMHTSGWDIIKRDPFGGREIVRILLLGIDDTQKGSKDKDGLSDTIVVLALNRDKREARAISIPRDTMVDIPGHGTRKINSAHVLGGPEMTRQAVSELLGVSVDYYLKTDISSLAKLVDMVGGVYIVVDKNMKYTDRRGGLYINLKASPEKQLLNGEQALGFVRFRHDKFGDTGYDIKDGEKIPSGRIVRQQYFIRALANRILSMPHKRDRMKVLETAYEKKFIVSDLNMVDWEAFADFFKDFEPEETQMDVLPGTPQMVHGASYWVPDQAEIPNIVAQNMEYTIDPPDPGETAKVEVLNGSGISGAAQELADRLKAEGYQVTRTGNAPTSGHLKCSIITYKGKTKPVQRLAQLIDCSNIMEEQAANPGADVTIIIGKDYAARKPLQ